MNGAGLRAALAWASGVLADAGVDSARSDAEWLMAHVLGTERGRLVIADDPTPDQLERFRAAVTARAARIPLQHIVGSAAFGPLDLAVGPGVFVPRPETEWLMTWAVEALGDTSTPLVVDLCSGSGALAIGIATLVPEARVVAVEKSDEALEWLRRNVAGAGESVAQRIRVVRADVTDAAGLRSALGAVGVAPGSVDLLVSNPPYVPEVAEVSPEVGHDPAMAVFGGPDGMRIIEPMLAPIADLLVPGGLVGIEHDESCASAVLGAVRATGRFDDAAVHADLVGRPRFTTSRRITRAATAASDGRVEG